MKNSSQPIVGQTAVRPCGHTPEQEVAAGPWSSAFEPCLREVLAESIRRAPEPEQFLLGLLYEHAMSEREAGAVLGLTDRQVHDLHARSMARLCSQLLAP